MVLNQRQPLRILYKSKKSNTLENLRISLFFLAITVYHNNAGKGMIPVS
jgi:hypothetical protein